MNEEFKYKMDLLKDEMQIAQNGIKAYNEAQFKVKGLAIPLLTGFLTFAADKHRPIFLLLSAVAVILFWIQDSFFQSIQRVYMDRAKEIEKTLNSPALSEAFDKEDLIVLYTSSSQISHIEAACTAWEKTKLRKMLREFKALQNILLYVPLLFLMLVLKCWL